MVRVRLGVVDDHTLFRAGLISLLADIAEVEVVGEARDGVSALDMVRDVNPDVLLLDVNMPKMGGVEVVRALRSQPPQKPVRIIMLTISKNEEDLLGAISAGADGYLLKSAEPEDLRKAIIQVHQGMSVLSPQVTRQVLRAAMSGESIRQLDGGLSQREMQVLKCLAQGKTTTQIAADLYISDNTVKTHVRHLLDKLEASNRAEAVSKATQIGLIGADE